MHVIRSSIALIVACLVFASVGRADGVNGGHRPPAATLKASDASDGSPIFGVRIPADYRRWQLIAVSQELAFDEFRGVVGNAVAIKAYRDGVLPFPDGAVLAKIAWKRAPSPEFDGAVVPGAPTTVQIMVKDATRYAATGGWGFGRFIGGKAVDRAQHETCFGCHAAHVKNHDFVFTRYAP